MVADAPPLRTSATLYYDGDCGFCDRTVAWLLARDPRGALRFAPLQGTTAATARATLPDWPKDVDSVVLVEGDGPDARVSWRTAAIAGALARLPGVWPWVARALDALPRALADAGYDAVARVRTHLAPPPSRCARLPAPLRARFLP